MDVHVRRESADRDLRRRQLAHRLVAHEARTRTISLLTGLSRHQMETLRQRWHIPKDLRHRGPTPTSFATFRANAQVREEAAALAVLWKCAGIAHLRGRAPVQIASLEFGEHLCDAFEIYLACILKSEFEFEYLALLARGLEEGGAIALSNCANCEAVILLDLLETRRQRCFHCQHSTQIGALPAGGSDDGSEDPSAGGEQQELF